MELFRRQSSAWRGAIYGLRRAGLLGKEIVTNFPAQNLRFALPVRSVFARHLYKYRTYEPAISNWLIDRVSEFDSGLLVDVGANFGWYSCLLARLCPDRTVLAYEPDPDNFSLLLAHLTLNELPRVQAFQLALGDESSVLKLHKYKASNSGRHSLLPINSGEVVDVPVSPLDDHLASLGLASEPIAFMKMDIEGYELFALRGANGALSRTRRLLVEYSPELMRQAGIDPHLMLRTLEMQGLIPMLTFGDRRVEASFAGLRSFGGQIDVLFGRTDA